MSEQIRIGIQIKRVLSLAQHRLLISPIKATNNHNKTTGKKKLFLLGLHLPNLTT